MSKPNESDVECPNCGRIIKDVHDEFITHPGEILLIDCPNCDTVIEIEQVITYSVGVSTIETNPVAKFKIGHRYIQRLYDDKLMKSGRYVWDSPARVDLIEDGWIICTIFVDVPREARFDLNGVRDDGKAYLVEIESND